MSDGIDRWRKARKKPVVVKFRGPYTDTETIETIEGDFKVDEEYIDEHGGYVIIRGVEGEVYPCGLDIFRETYERGGAKHPLSRHGDGTMTDTYFARLEQYKQRVPEQYHSVFDELTARGHNPKAIGATVEYIEIPDKSQEDCAEEWGVPTVTIRNHLDEIEELVTNDKP